MCVFLWLLVPWDEGFACTTRAEGGRDWQMLFPSFQSSSSLVWWQQLSSRIKPGDQRRRSLPCGADSQKGLEMYKEEIRENSVRENDIGTICRLVLVPGAKNTLPPPSNCWWLKPSVGNVGQDHQLIKGRKRKKRGKDWDLDTKERGRERSEVIHHPRIFFRLRLWRFVRVLVWGWAFCFCFWCQCPLFWHHLGLTRGHSYREK